MTYTDEFVAYARYGELEEMKALMCASRHSNDEAKAIRDLCTGRAPPSNSTALHMASANNHTDVISFLLQHLAPKDVNIRNDDGSTALHWACVNGHKDAASLLLKAGADLAIKNAAGKSAVAMAEQQGHLEVSQLLLQSCELDSNSIQESNEKATVHDNDMADSAVNEQVLESFETISIGPEPWPSSREE
ncbi:hypothetical protein SeMB42_g04052 [Synchytrium endobioticum]|uniref:protein S-acyltransferase n=1 Tax=Synchytrium endobioticum TaxID=286115 RepID=A0A507DI61_9FUNG|nr:hypothetical protein SeMB42_g04052 [Synchytrium endobioticum]TPX51005.1 hypothetical protein SeLEV6574_g00591 [Synchytrium endobioticum]